MYQDKNKVWRFGIFEKYPESNIGVSDVSFGNLSFTWGEVEEVRANREKFRLACGVNQQNIAVIACEQKTKCVEAISGNANGWLASAESTNCDCLFTKENLGLFLPVADCAPVAIFDPKNHAVALVHSGWGGAHQNIVGEAVKKLIEHFGSDPTDLIVGVGPTVCQKEYWHDKLPEELRPNWERYCKIVADPKSPSGFYYYIDLEKKILDQLEEAGIKKDNIETSEICTISNKSFFSHFRSKNTGEKEGRFGMLVELK